MASVVKIFCLPVSWLTGSLSNVSTAMETPFSFMPSRQMNGAVRQASFFAMDMSGRLAEILSSAASATDL